MRASWKLNAVQCGTEAGKSTESHRASAMLQRLSAAPSVLVGLALGLALSYIQASDASRNGSGTYSLPSGNPVVAGTTITASNENAFRSDVATELTNSLDRGGRGAMTAALACYAGTVSSPGLTFDGDTDTGLYRIGANNIGIATNGSKVVDVSTSGVGVTGTLSASGVASLADGTMGTPGLNFSGDTNTGLYRIGADNLGVAANGAKVLDVSTSGLGVTGTLTSSGAATLASLTVSGTLTNPQVPQAWADIKNTTINAGSGVTSVACSSSCADVTLTTARADTNYAVLVTSILEAAGGTRELPGVHIEKTSTTVFRVCLHDTTGAVVNACVGNERFSVLVLGN